MTLSTPQTWPWLVPVCPDCGVAGEHKRTCTVFPLKPVVHGNYVAVVPLGDVVAALNEAYHPQNPLSMHPADFVTKKFEGPGHENLRYA